MLESDAVRSIDTFISGQSTVFGLNLAPSIVVPVEFMSQIVVVWYVALTNQPHRSFPGQNLCVYRQKVLTC